MIRYTKETFPEKYAIKCTEENAEVLLEWRSIKCKPVELIDYYLHSHYQGDIGYAKEKVYEGYTEVTFQDFKKFVLNIDGLKDENMKYLIKFFRKLGIR
jgi:hypothetical protein